MVKYYYLDGEALYCCRDFSRTLHRLDGPAVEYPNGSKEWYRNGLLHRLNGPAVEFPNGEKRWCLNGRFHRLDGPAIEYNDVKMWYQNGLLHRLNGPAVVYTDGTMEWHIDGKELTQKEFEKTTLIMQLSGLLNG